MARNFWIDRGSYCRVANDRGISEEIRGQRIRVIHIRADGNTVQASMQSGPARGATQLLSLSEIASCRKARRRRQRA